MAGRGVKQNSDKVWQGGGGKAKEWWHSFENVLFQIASLSTSEIKIGIFLVTYFLNGPGDILPHLYLELVSTDPLMCLSIGERAGALTAVCRTRGEASSVLSQLRQIVRPMYSNPPNHGAHIVATILNDPTLEKIWWVFELKVMKEVKKVFKAETKRNSSDTDSLLQRIKVGIGVFSELSNR